MAQQSWKARQMVPGQDTISIMAMHYGFKPSQVRDIIKAAGVEVIREDGFKGQLVSVKGSRTPGWSDGQVGVDPATTKLTRPAIKAVADWAWRKSEENGDDN